MNIFSMWVYTDYINKVDNKNMNNSLNLTVRFKVVRTFAFQIAALST